MSGNTAELQANILFWIIIALFAWQGYQRGIWSELTKLAFIIAGFLLGMPEYLGKTLVKLVNNITFAIQFLIHGGATAIIIGNFNATTLNKIFTEIKRLPPPIPKENAEMAMFLAMVFLILIGYLVSTLLKKDKMPGMALVIGALNGYLLSIIFLPLLPDEPPFTFKDMSVTGVVKQLGELFSYLVELLIKGVAGLLNFMFDTFGTWAIPIILFAIVIITLASLTRGKKKSSASSGGTGGGS